VAGWWVGLFDESIHLFKELKQDPTMLPIHIQAVHNNLRNLEGTVWREPLTYYQSMYERLRVKFPGAREIERNYSQCMQDMFVLTMLDGKWNGRFLEIGCGHPTYGNNTKLLEDRGWLGISIDSDPEITREFIKERRFVMTEDATRLDFDALLRDHEDYDYLQIDIDPALNSLAVLLKIPFERVKFAVITFETDFYTSGPMVRTRAREYLKSHGYVLVVGDIAPDSYNAFEDWYVCPTLVDPKIIEKMLAVKEGPIRADTYMLNG
jgi:hypothetical protein